MLAGLLQSETLCFGHWQQSLSPHHCLAVSWQRRLGWITAPIAYLLGAERLLTFEFQPFVCYSSNSPNSSAMNRSF